MTPFRPDRPLLGVGLKMYFSLAETRQWLERLVDRLGDEPAIVEGEVQLFVLPGFLALPDAQRILGPTAITWGAQDFFYDDSGPFTGAVSARDLTDVSCSYVEVGHKERREVFGESDEVIAKKISQALRHGLTPIICVGEAQHTTPEEAAAVCRGQLDTYLGDSRASGLTGSIVVAYEPYWAIGAPEPASNDYITQVHTLMSEAVADYPNCSMIYGGSAGPGMLPTLYPAARGLFLGRSAHNLDNVHQIVREAQSLV